MNQLDYSMVTLAAIAGLLGGFLSHAYWVLAQMKLAATAKKVMSAAKK